MKTAHALLLLTFATPALADEPRRLVEGIVVRVNDRILTTSDMRQRVAERLAETGRPVPPAQYPDLVRDAADELCMLERGVELKIEVSDDEVSAAVKDLRVQNRVEDEATFEQMLLSTGMTLKSLRARLRDTMIVNRVLSREVGNFPITEEELRQRLARDEELYREPEKVHLEHVVYSLAPDDKDRAEKEAAARRLVAAVRAGGDFLTLVKQETETGLATGGDLGELVDTDLRDEIRLAVALLKPGEVSDPFFSLAGVHVVRVVERIPSKVKPFETVVEELRQREMSDRYRDRMTGIVEDLKKRYVVEVHPELFQPPT